MNKKITAFLPFHGADYTHKLVAQLTDSDLVEKIFLLSSDDKSKMGGCETLVVQNHWGTETVEKIISNVSSGFVLILLDDVRVELQKSTLERFIETAESTGAGIVYSDFYELINRNNISYPLINYLPGSLRDDFDFGSLLLLKISAIKRVVQLINKKYKYAGFYDLRLKISENNSLLRIPENLYTIKKQENKRNSEEQFAYLNPQNREIQNEMEDAVTEHLQRIGAFLEPDFERVNFEEYKFNVEASVVIPVKNRESTIGDAIKSALKQKTDFSFNIIVIDNHSDDGTGKVIESFVKKDKRVTRLIPKRKDLEIGGCWNEAVQNSLCGKFVCQLDSDDLYKDENTLQKIIEVFKKKKLPW